MTAKQIDELIESAATHLRSLGTELQSHIQEAASACLEEAAETETKARLTIPFSITVDLSKNPPSYAYKLKVCIARSLSVEGQLDDPQQPNLQL